MVGSLPSYMQGPRELLCNCPYLQCKLAPYTAKFKMIMLISAYTDQETSTHQGQWNRFSITCGKELNFMGHLSLQ